MRERERSTRSLVDATFLLMRQAHLAHFNIFMTPRLCETSQSPGLSPLTFYKCTRCRSCLPANRSITQSHVPPANLHF